MEQLESRCRGAEAILNLQPNSLIAVAYHSLFGSHDDLILLELDEKLLPDLLHEKAWKEKFQGTLGDFAMEFLNLFLVALMPVLKVLLMTAVGLFLATDTVDLLGPSATDNLNNLVFYVFGSALVGSSLAESITVKSFATLWFIPVNILVTHIIGSVLGLILIKITGTPKHLQGVVLGCCTAGNAGNLLLIILPALCEENYSPFGDSTVCSKYGEAYAVLSMAVLAFYIWTYIYYIIIWISKSDGIKETNGYGDRAITIPGGEISDTMPESYTEALLPPQSCQSMENSSAPVELPHSKNEEKWKQASLIVKIMQYFKAFTSKINLKRVVAPSTIALIIGLIIGMVSPIRKILIGSSAPLRVIYSSAALLGEAAIPCITMIVGANLLRGLRGSEASWSVITGITVIRFLLLPPLGILIVKAALHYGIVTSYPLYQFTLMLHYAVPPAMSIGTITQLVKAGESECSVVMLWTYAVSTFFLTLWSACFMWLVT